MMGRNGNQETKSYQKGQILEDNYLRRRLSFDKGRRGHVF